MIYPLVFTILLAAALMALSVGTLLHLQGTPLLVLRGVIVLAGLAGAAIMLILHFRSERRKGEATDAGESGGGEAELNGLLDDANRKLRSAQNRGPKSLHGLPMLYLLGETSSAKTTIVVRSGLDPELIAGSAPRDGDVSPTPLLNLWFTRKMAILEAGESVRQSVSMLDRMIARTRPKAYRSTFGSRPPVRAAVVCVSVEQLLGGNSATSSLASARTIGAQLRQISKRLGAALPVYVLITKLDRVPHFAEYVHNLSQDEVQQMLGTTLARSGASAGVYADSTSRALGSALDSLGFALADFRVEMLARETEPRNAAGLYEFPREFAKLRRNLTSYLVELCKPSQLSANPYLRGFYFCGVRAVQVEQGGPGVQAPQPLQSGSAEVGATRIFSAQDMQAASRSTVQPARSATRAPQWVFLSRLFPETILGDKSALSATQQTAPARRFRRVLFATSAILFALATALFAVSYFDNLALEQQLIGAVRQLPIVVDASAVSAPTPADLQALDKLRLTIAQLDGYAQDGPPWNYRFGLYQGDKLASRARQIYFDRFRAMLLNGAQANFVTYLRALPSASVPGADYNAAYNPLKAYLMTTSNPEKSVPSFLVPELMQYWTKAKATDSVQAQLARQQFNFYSNELIHRNPYAIRPDVPAVNRARTYLASFGAQPRIYESMLVAADKTSPEINFNQQYPNASTWITEPHRIRGAYTRSGFTFMQDALQHPDRYFQGETWVLGEQASSSLDTVSVSKQLTAKYSGGYIEAWHAFLADAKVLNCPGIKEEPDKLKALAASDSPILEFFYTISSNTAVGNDQIKKTFQPTQKLVDPNSPDLMIGAGNKDYVDMLLGLAGAVDQFNQAPETAKDASITALITALSSAKLVVPKTAQGFNVDPQMQTDKLVTTLLGSPLRCIGPPAPAPLAGPPATMCTTLGKFPFTRLSREQALKDLTNNQQASLDEVNALFAPGTGSLWSYYDKTLKAFLVVQGSTYVPTPAAEGHVGPEFIKYFNRVVKISDALYAAGGTGAGFNFDLHFVRSPGVESASLVVDGQRIPEGATTEHLKWNAALASQASLAYNTLGGLHFKGTWSLFQLINNARITRTSAGLELAFPIEVSGRPSTLDDGTPVEVHFVLSGPGAEALDPQGLYGLPCTMTVTK